MFNTKILNILHENPLPPVQIDPSFRTTFLGDQDFDLSIREPSTPQRHQKTATHGFPPKTVWMTRHTLTNRSYRNIPCTLDCHFDQACPGHRRRARNDKTVTLVANESGAYLNFSH